MTDFTVIEAKRWHCGAMSRQLRLDHARAVAKFGIDSHREIRARFDASTFRRAWMIDGKLAALGGVTGTRLEAEGHVWLAFSEIATSHPVAMVKEARHQIAEITAVKPVLITSVLAGDDAAKRFAVFLGFVPMDGQNSGPATTRFGRRDMMRRLDGEGVPMKYEPDREAA